MKQLPNKWLAINGNRVDAESIAKWFFQVDDPQQNDCKTLVEIAIEQALLASTGQEGEALDSRDVRTTWIHDHAPCMDNGGELRAFYTLLDSDAKVFKTEHGLRFELPCKCFILQDESSYLRNGRFVSCCQKHDEPNITLEKLADKLAAAAPAEAPEPRETLDGLINVYSAMHNSGAKAIAFPLLLEDLRKLTLPQQGRLVTPEMLFCAINPDEAEHAEATVKCYPRLWGEAANRLNAALSTPPATAESEPFSHIAKGLRENCFHEDLDGMCGAAREALCHTQESHSDFHKFLPVEKSRWAEPPAQPEERR